LIFQDAPLYHQLTNLEKQVGALNKIPIAVMGYVCFGAPVNKHGILGIGIGLIGGIVFTLAKLEEMRNGYKTRDFPPPKPTPPAPQAQGGGGGGGSGQGDGVKGGDNRQAGGKPWEKA
jgi:hypothetical protein